MLRYILTPSSLAPTTNIDGGGGVIRCTNSSLFCFVKKNVCSKPDLVCDADDLHICSRLLRVQLRQHSPLHLQHWLQSKQVGTFEENIILENICFVSLVWFTICSVRISRVIPREAISGPVPWSGSQLQHRLWLVCWRLNISDQTWRELTGFLLSFVLKYFFFSPTYQTSMSVQSMEISVFPPKIETRSLPRNYFQFFRFSRYFGPDFNVYWDKIKSFQNWSVTLHCINCLQ